MPDTHAHDPHAGQPVLHRGAAPRDARLAVVLVHGRGASADDILGLADALSSSGDVAWLAPQAAQRSWYPLSFLAPVASNQPHLDSALAALARLLDDLARAGVPAGRTALVGFSQGACLALEFAARHAQRFAAVAGLSGGLIGPPGTPRDYPGTLAGTPVFLGCGDRDGHIPVDRVHESAAVFGRLGAGVDARIYPGMGHAINQDELDAVARLLA